MLTLDQISAAAGRAAPYVARTPVIALGDGRFLKLESLQPTGSFKVRGFFAAALALPAERLQRGLLTVSAGNAAQAAAYVAHTLGVACRVFMLDSAPAAKVNGVRRWGATPVLVPRTELMAWMDQAGWEQEPETFIHPFADDQVIAGHGGIGLELLEQTDGLERIFVAAGGGGLISGVASAIRASGRAVEIVGVQSEGYPLWPRVVEAGGPVPLTPHTIADGTTAPFNPAMFARLQELVDRWVLIPEAGVRAAIRELAASVKVVAEGAGALGYAALKLEPRGSAAAAVLSGANIDLNLLRDILAEDPDAAPSGG